MYSDGNGMLVNDGGNASGTKVIKFTAKWCAPCKAMVPTVDKLLAEGYDIEDKDIEQHPDLAESYGVHGVPTMILIDNDGQEIKRHTGALTYKKFKEFFDAREG